MIRIAQLRDLESILKLNKYLFEYEKQYDNTYNLEWTYSEQGKEYFKKRLIEDNGIVLMAEVSGAIVGYLCGFIDDYSYRSVGPIAEIENMFVEEKLRDKGIGSELIQKFEEIALSRGTKRFRVGTLFQNDEAINFYRKNGFKNFELYLEK